MKPADIIKEQKKMLEENITSLIKSFEERSGTKVSHIFVDRVELTEFTGSGNCVLATEVTAEI